jgi:ABC-type transport system substrate-binding protein
VGIAQPPGSHGRPDTGLLGVSWLLQNASLVTIGTAGRPQPALAERWDVSGDGLVWRFAIRPGLRFHDGSKLDASAAVEVVRPEELAENPFSSPPGFRDIDSVDAPTPQELVIRLRRPSSLLLEALALVPVRGGPDGATGAGPFMIGAQRAGLIALRAFDGYYRGRPQIDRVELRSYGTQRTAWGAMMRNEVDVLYEVAPEAVEFVQSGGDARAFGFLRPYVYVLGFNLSHPVLGRQAVRRALNHAVDRSAIIARALAGRGLPATGHVWPRHWTYGPGIDSPGYDPMRTLSELDAAGLPMPAGQPAGARPPARFRFTALVPAEYPLLERIALVLEKQLSDVGVDMVLDPVPLRDFATRLAQGRYDAYVQEMAAGQGLNWPYWFWHSPEGGATWVRTGYRSADPALDELRAATTDDALRGSVRRFETTVVDDPPALFLCWGEVFRAVRRRFIVPPEADRDIMSTLSHWRAAPVAQP